MESGLLARFSRVLGKRAESTQGHFTHSPYSFFFAAFLAPFLAAFLGAN